MIEVTLNISWLLVQDGQLWVFQKPLIYWDFPTQLWGLQRMKNKKQRARVNPQGENASLLLEIRGEWPDVFELIGRKH